MQTYFPDKGSCCLKPSLREKLNSKRIFIPRKKSVPQSDPLHFFLSRQRKHPNCIPGSVLSVLHNTPFFCHCESKSERVPRKKRRLPFWLLSHPFVTGEKLKGRRENRSLRINPSYSSGGWQNDAIIVFWWARGIFFRAQAALLSI